MSFLQQRFPENVLICYFNVFMAFNITDSFGNEHVHTWKRTVDKAEADRARDAGKKRAT